MNLKNITNEQIDVLLKICKENSNRKNRWPALQNHPISKELDLTDIKDFTKQRCCAHYDSEGNLRYTYSVEAIFTGYNVGGDDPSVIVERSELHGEHIGYDYIRWALSGDPNTEWNYQEGGD